MSEKGIDVLRQQIVNEIYQNNTNDISGQKLQDQLTDMMDSLYKGTYTSTIPYKVGQIILYTDDKFYKCIVATSPGDTPVSAPTKWHGPIGGNVTFISTIGTDGDYATVEEAIADTKYNLVFISDVTETSGIGISDNTIINLNSYTWNLGNNTISRPSLSKLYIENGSINVQRTVAGASIGYRNESSYYTIFKGVTFTNSTALNNSPIIDGYASISECIVNLANTSSSGFGGTAGGTGLGLIVTDCEFIGGGPACQIGLQAYGTSFSDNILYTGIFKVNDYISLLAEGTHSNHTINTSAGNRIYFGRVVNLVDLTTSYSVYITKYIGDSEILGLGGAAFPPDNIIVSNVRFIHSSTLTFGNNKMVLDNCTFLNGVIVTGDSNTFSNCNIGSVNGGVKTITVSAGADKCIITNCRTEADIAYQPDTILIGNQKF